MVTPGERLSQVRDAVTSLRDLDGPDLHTPVVMAVRGPKARALAVDLADTVTFASTPSDSRAEIMRLAADFRAIRGSQGAVTNAARFPRNPAPGVAPPATSGLHARSVDRRGRVCPQADPVPGTDRSARLSIDPGAHCEAFDDAA